MRNSGKLMIRYSGLPKGWQPMCLQQDRNLFILHMKRDVRICSLSLTKEEKCSLLHRWKNSGSLEMGKKIKEGKIAPDTLLTLAGLASFTADQEMLDQRIRDIIE